MGVPPPGEGNTSLSGRPGEKGAGGVREAREEGAEAKFPRKREKKGILRNIAQYFAIEKCKEVKANNTGWEPGLKVAGSRRFNPPPHPPCICHVWWGKCSLRADIS